jgi:hypothetical protein
MDRKFMEVNVCNSFKQFLESTQSEYIFSYKDKNIIRTNHKKDRYETRNTSNEFTIDLFKKAIDWLIKKGKSNKKYAFISKSSKLGMMVDFRPDTKQPELGDQLILITWFGNIEKDLRGNKTPENFKLKFPSDIKVLVENFGSGIDEIVFV